MADIESNIRIDIDTSSALASIKALQSQISQLQKEMSAASASTAANARNLQRQLVADINATGQFSAGFKTIRSTTESFTNSLEKNKLSMGEYFRFGSSQIRGFRNVFSSEFNTIEKVARERVKTLQTQYISLGRDANGALQSIAVRPLALDMNNLGTQAAITAQKQQIFNQLLKQGSTNLLNFGKNTQWAGRQLMVGFTIPLSIFGGMASKTFMELEEQAIRFKRVYGELFTPEAETDAMVEQIKELASEFTKYGVAVEATLGLAADAAAMGAMGADLLAQTTEATRLAVLGGVDQQEALKTTISLQNALGISSENLAEATDFLNAVENQTVTAIEDLTIAIPKAAPVIRQMGGDVKDLAFFLTAMKEGGINASEGANALKSGLASLINPTQEASDMLEMYGINIRDIVESNRGDVAGLVVEFAKSLDELNPLQRARAIEQLFGKFQFARISTLFQNVISEGTQAQRVLELANATTSELAQLSTKELARVEESTTFKFKKAIEDFQAALAPVGEEFLKLLTPLIEIGTKILQQFNNMSDGAKGFVTGLVGILGGVLPIFLMTFGLIANGVANLIKGFAAIRGTFLNLRDSSSILGQQIEYMTQEQLEAAAVAASLDQTHSKLVQTFTAETGAANNLIAAYQKMAAAQTKLMGRPIPTNIGRGGAAPKLAGGGILKGPGTGTSDSIVAMLSNGEAVIPAKSVRENPEIVNLLISGKEIPGFARGANLGPVTSTSGTQYQTVFAHIGDSLVTSIQDVAMRLQAAGQSIPKDFQQYLAAGLGNVKVRAYGGLGFETSQKFNEAMKPGGQGVAPATFLEDYDKRGLAKWNTSLKVANLKLADVEKDLGFLDREIKRQINEQARLSDTFVVTDANLEQFSQNSLNRLKTRGSDLADGFELAKRKVTEIRAMPRQSQLRGAGMVPVPGRAKYFMAPDDPSNQIKAGRGIKRVSRTRGGVYGLMLSDFEQSLAKEAKTASPSKRTRKVAKDTVDGYVQGLEEGKKKAKRAGVQTARYRDPVTGRFATPPTQAGAAAQVIPQQISNQQRVAGERLSRMNNALQGSVFAITSLAGAASMMGGKVGEVSNKIFQLSGVLFALMQVTQMLTQANFLELIQKRKAIATTAVENAQKAGSIVAGGGFINIIKTIGVRFAAFLGPIGMVVAGMAALGGIIALIIGAQKKQKENIEGLGNTAYLAAEKMKAAGELLGFDPKTAAFGQNIVAGTAAASGATQASAIQELRGNEEFRNQFAQQINAIRNATTEQAEQALQSLAIQQFGAGASVEAVNTLVKAIAQEAERTDLNLSFANLNFETEEGIQQIGINAQSAADSFAQAFSDGLIKPMNNVIDGEKVFASFTGEGQQIAEQSAAQFASSFQTLKDALANNLINADQFSTQLAIINGQLSDLEAGQIAVLMPTLAEKLGLAETFEGIESVRDQILLLNADAAGIEISESTLEVLKNADQSPGAARAAARARRQLVEQVREQAKEQEELNKKIEEQQLLDEKVAAGLLDLQSKTTELKNQRLAYDSLIAAGYDAETAFELAGNAILAASVASAITAEDAAEKMAEIKAGIDAFLAERALTIPDPSAGAGSATKSPFQQAIEDLREQRDELRNTTEAYNKLRRAGVEINEAFEASQDSVLATALATTKVGTKKWEDLVKLIKQVDELARKNAIKDLLKEQAAARQLNQAFVSVAQTLGKMGYSAQEINDILSEPALAQEFIKDLEDGKIDSKLIRDYLNGIEKDKRITIDIQLSTPEGIQSEFERLYGEASEAFRVRRDRVEDDFEDRIKDAQSAIDETKKSIDATQKEIDDIQTTIGQKQREIEIEITRPIEEMQETISGLQRDIELQFDRPIGALQEEASDLANDLSLMDKEIEDINDKYEKQLEALEDILSINDQLSEQQRTQLDIADALSRGDIAAAARAAQELQQQQAAQRADASRQRIEQARELEIERVKSAAGLTRTQIEERQFEIAQQIYQLEEQRELVQGKILQIQDGIYALETLREARMLSIRGLEDQIYAIQNGRLLQLQFELQDRENILEKIEEEKNARLEVIALEEEAWNDAKLAFDEAMQRGKDYIQMLKDAIALIQQLLSLTPTTPETVGGSPRTTGGGSQPEPAPSPAPAPAPAPAPGSAPTGVALTTKEEIDTAIKATNARVEAIDNTIKSNAAVIKAFGSSSPVSQALLKQNAANAYTKSWELKAAYALKQKSDSLVVSKTASRPLFLASGGMVPSYMRMGGLLPYKAEGGSIFKPLGTDTVPAMLTPGEFVVRKYAVEKFGLDNLKAINSGANPSDSVYNYSVNVNVKSDANPDQIARAVMTQIKQVDSMRLRGNRF